MILVHIELHIASVLSYRNTCSVANVLGEKKGIHSPDIKFIILIMLCSSAPRAAEPYQTLAAIYEDQGNEAKAFQVLFHLPITLKQHKVLQYDLVWHILTDKPYLFHQIYSY